MGLGCTGKLWIWSAELDGEIVKYEQVATSNMNADAEIQS